MKKYSLLKPNEPIKALKKQKVWERFGYCAAMLYVHGFLTEEENRKIRARINFWCGQPIV